MSKKYIAGAFVLGLLFIGGAWLFQDEPVVSKNNAPQGGVVYDAPAQTAAPAAQAGGDAKF